MQVFVNNPKKGIPEVICITLFPKNSHLYIHDVNLYWRKI